LSESEIEKEVRGILEEVRFTEGLIWGLFLGILGNLWVSSMIEMIDTYGNATLFHTWILVFVLSSVATAYVAFHLLVRIAKRMIQGVDKIFPSVLQKKPSKNK